MPPLLSICVPSRNRQATFIQTIRDLLASERRDVEFVFADNSDDGAIAEAFMATIADPRVTFLPSLGHALPMQDNWERTMRATSGEWVVFIGDDDYVDPDVADILAEIGRRRPQVEAVGWSRMSFKWPDYRPFTGNACVALANVASLTPREAQMRALFQWHGAKPVPKVAFSAYHGAVRRRAMDRIRDRFSGRYFEHPTVDFDCSAKLLLTAGEFVYVDRALSVLGATAKSNSSAVGRYDRVREINDALLPGEGECFEVPGFPFTNRLGVAASILSTLYWFSTRYGLPLEGWQENFVNALAIDCGKAEDRASFDRHVVACRRAVEAFEGGRWLDAFAPRFTPRRRSASFTGLRGTTLFVDERIGDAATPAEFYRIVQTIMPPVGGMRFAFEAAAVEAAPAA
jgi:glycosyltransferase involved in cell wall biosynthesis